MALEDIREVKLNKLNKIKEKGINPYPSKTNRTYEIADVIENFEKLENSKEKLIIVGRIMSVREHGGSVFADIKDGTGKIQAYFKKDALGKEKFEFFSSFVGLGDFIEVSGDLFKTKKGEKTVKMEDFGVLSKSLLPLPEKWHGLQDVEERYRKRYLDLIFNEEVKTKFQLRSKMIQEIRNHFLNEGFLEVETPVLQTLPGGAAARPFKTHMNDLDLDLYLRIAPELYLKRLLVGGFEKVFELGKSFRNEGINREHNPEFTILEAYAAYRDYEWMMDFVENLLKKTVKKVFGSYELKIKESKIDFSRKIERKDFNGLLEKYIDINYGDSSEKELKSKAEELGVEINKKMSKGVVADEIFKKAIRPNIVQPLFVINHPLEISPLAKKIKNNPDHVERFQLLVGGMEVVNAFSELNDPLEQKERFEAQEKSRKAGDEEAHRMDDDFLESLEYGMPPAAGVGIGIDRLVTLFSGSNTLREVILFPTMKPKEK